MKFGMLSNMTAMNRFVLHTTHQNNAFSVIIRKTNSQMVLKGGSETEPFT